MNEIAKNRKKIQSKLTLYYKKLTDLQNSCPHERVVKVDRGIMGTMIGRSIVAGENAIARTVISGGLKRNLVIED